MYISSNAFGSITYQSLFTHNYDVTDVVSAPVLFDNNNTIVVTDVYNTSLKSPNYSLITGSCLIGIPITDAQLKEINDNVPGLNMKVLPKAGKLQIDNKDVATLVCAYEGMHYRTNGIDPLLIPFSNYYSMFTNTQNIRYYTPDPKTYGLVVGSSDNGEESPNIVINEPSSSLLGHNCPIINFDKPCYLGVVISPYFSQWSAYLVNRLSELTVNFSYHAQYFCYVKLDDTHDAIDINMSSPVWQFNKAFNINAINGFGTTGSVSYPFSGHHFRGDSLCVLPYHTNYPFDNRSQYEFKAEDFVKMLDKETDVTKQIMDNIGGRCYKLHPEFDRYNVNFVSKKFIYATVYKDINFSRCYSDITSLTHNYDLAMYLKQFIVGNPNYLTWWYNSSNILKNDKGSNIDTQSFVFKFNERFNFSMT